MSNSVCQVCSNKKGVFRYYGGLCCASCKVFFLRAITGKEQYVCSKDGSCEITPERWTKNCRGCRFEKCLKACMDPAAVGTGQLQKRSTKAENQLRLEPLRNKHRGEPSTSRQDRLPEIHSTKSASEIVFYFTDSGRPMKPLYTQYSYGLNFLRQLQENHGDTLKYVTTITALENDCYSDTIPSCQFEEIFDGQNMDVELRSAMQNPLQVCRRTPMQWDTVYQLIPSIQKNATNVYCRLIVHYLDWVSGIPDLIELNEEDKANLIASQLCHVLLTQIVYHTYTTGCSGINFSSGYHYVLTKPTENASEFDRFMYQIALFGQNEIIPVFKKLKITREEYVLLKAIGLFSCSMSLSDEGMEILRKARLKHEALLVAYVDEQFGGLTREERAARVHDIVSLNKNLASMAAFDNAYVVRMVTMNIAGFQSQLTYDVHIKHF